MTSPRNGLKTDRNVGQRIRLAGKPWLTPAETVKRRYFRGSAGFSVESGRERGSRRRDADNAYVVPLPKL